MDSSVWIWFLLSMKMIDGFENLSRRQTTTVSQSSTYHIALLAIDGNQDQRDLYCAHTSVNEFKQLAWFQVDLGNLYRLQGIKIFFRDEGVNKWRPYRSRQFYLDVSNSSISDTRAKERVTCCKDNTTNSAVPPNIVTITCKRTARYIIIETTYHAPEDTISTGPVLEVCEIEIYGCSINCMGPECNTSGYCTKCTENKLWGPTCDNHCSKYCNSRSCIRDSGFCDQGCPGGFWGRHCNQSCSENCNEGGCSPENGHCINGCKPYFGGEKCELCDPTHYGQNCERPCSKNCFNDTCFASNGTCTLGCSGHFKDSLCAPGNTIDYSTTTAAYLGAGVGTVVFLLISVLFFVFAIRLKKRKQSTSTTSVIYEDMEKDTKDQTNMYSTIGSISVKLEGTEETAQIEKSGKSVYYSNLTASRDISVANLQNVIKDKKRANQNECFMK